MVLSHPANLGMIGFLAMTLTMGLFLLYDLARPPHEQLLTSLQLVEEHYYSGLSQTTVRKGFHLLALVLYTPMHAAVL